MRTFYFLEPYLHKIRAVPSLNWLALILLVIATAAGCTNGAGRAEAGASADSTEEARTVHIKSLPVAFRTMNETVDGLGRCETLPDRTAALAPALEGQVLKFAATLGDTVTIGQPIVELDARGAQANLAEKIATRDGLEASLKLLTVAPRPEELKAQEVAVKETSLAVKKAQLAADRLRPLLAKQEISPAQMEEAETAVSLAMLQEQAAAAQLQAMKLGPRPEAIAEAQARINTATAQIRSAQLELDKHTLKAPIAGVLDNLSCQLGQTVAAGAAIGQIVDTTKLLVVVWLPSHTANQVRAGQSAIVFSTANHSVQLENAMAQADDETKDATGKVVFVGSAVDAQTGNLPVHILIDNSDRRFASGQAVTTRIIVHEKKDVLAVPLAALCDVGEGAVINVIRNGKSVVARPKLGIRDQHWAEVISTDLSEALKSEEQVIVEGGYNLPAGTHVSSAVDDAAEPTTSEKSSEPKGAAK